MIIITKKTNRKQKKRHGKWRYVKRRREIFIFEVQTTTPRNIMRNYIGVRVTTFTFPDLYK